MTEAPRPALLVLASTYPRWQGDHEPGFVHELCKRLTARFDVTVLTSRTPQAARRETIDGVDVIRYGYAPRKLETLVYGGGIAANLKRSKWKLALVPAFIAAQYLAARRIVRTQRVDVVHAHWLIPQGLVARHLARRHSIPYLVTSHGGDLFGLRGAWLTKLKRRVAKSAAAMTVVSSAMLEEARRIGLQPPRTDVVPMGADMRTRFTPAETAATRGELLFVGRLVAKKGLTHLLNSLPAVVQARPAVTLTIAGFGPEEAALKAQAATLGIESHIHFTGPVAQEQLPALYRRAALLVAPFVRDASGDQEGLPVVLMEAIACGCPILAGDVSGVHDLLGADAERLVVDAKDTDRLTGAILDSLADPEARERAQRLRESVLRRFDWTVIAERYADWIARCIPDRRGSGSQSSVHAGTER